ncbi:MAG: glycosyltransferase family 4 protein [Pseudomonadota bacterium]
MSNSASQLNGVIAHVNLAHGYRGGERQTELLIRELAKRGVRQRLVARTGEPLIVRLADEATLDRRAVGGIVGAARALKGASLAHAHEGRCVQATALARWLSGVPYIITRRVVRPISDNLIMRRVYGKAAARVGISSSIADAMEAYVPGPKPHVIPSAVTPVAPDKTHVRALRERWGTKPVVGHVGALIGYQKGQPLLIEAARTRPGVAFVFVGSGPDEDDLRAQAAGLDNVHFTGQVDDVASHLASFDLFAFPSLFEGLGSILLDAMFLELPIVAARTGGIPDIIKHENNGLLVPTDDAPALGAAIDRLLGDADLQTRFAQANREAIGDYSASRMADRYLALYTELMA